MLIVLAAASAGNGARADRRAWRSARHPARGRRPRLPPDLKFSHLTTEDGLAQDNVVAILQDRRGFMWFATGEGLNRYDGNSFVVYKNDPKDPGSLSHNFIRTVFEDAQGYLWVAAYPGINRFDPRTERSTRYCHDPKNPKSFSGDSFGSVTGDVAAITVRHPNTGWTSSTRRPKHSRTTAMTPPASSSGGSGVSSRIGAERSGSSPTVASFI